MYEAFYGLRERPFSLVPDPDFLYLSQDHSRAYNTLAFGLASNAGLILITGEVGAGKTTLIHKLLQDLEDEISIGFIRNAHGGFGELLEWVAAAFELDCKGLSKTQIYHLFNDFLVKQYAKGRRTALIIDEAQNLSADALEELRMLNNINAGKHGVLQLILSGQSELLTLLQQPELNQLAQRISVDYHLSHLNLRDTMAYIEHRIAHVGGDPQLFTMGTSVLIYYFSRGVPRLINTLADLALVYGYGENCQKIEPWLIMEVLQDKSRSGIFPIEHPDTPDFMELRQVIQEKVGVDVTQLDAKAVSRGQTMQSDADYLANL